MACSWVPVVDHEVPIGDGDEQAVIPIDYSRGRVGETQRIDEGDYVLLWIKDIEPNGSVMVEYASGQYVGYQPPPLLGEPEPGTTAPYPYDAAAAANPDALMAPRSACLEAGLFRAAAGYSGHFAFQFG